MNWYLIDFSFLTFGVSFLSGMGRRTGYGWRLAVLSAFVFMMGIYMPS